MLITGLFSGISSSVVSSLCQLLYGASVQSCRDTLGQLHRLVDVLGIQLSLVTEAAASTADPAEHEPGPASAAAGDYLAVPEVKVFPPAAGDGPAAAEDMETIIAEVESGRTPSVPPSLPVAEETVGGEELPLCCYHCSQPFQTLEALSSHICTKAGRGKRHHRCNQCGTVLSSMWRLRQHLATHSQGQGARGSGMDDHVYGRSSRRDWRHHPTSSRGQVKGDHDYAGAKKHPKETVAEEEASDQGVTSADHGYAVSRGGDHQYSGTGSSPRQIQFAESTLIHTLTPPGSRYSQCSKYLR